jgi:hypothetical protein
MTRWVSGISRDILRAAFRDYFGVADEHVDVLVVLYSRPGEWVKVKRLQVLLDSHRPPKRQAVYERIRVLREAMEPESLTSGGQLDDLGYALSSVGYRECNIALRSLAEALVRDCPVLIAPTDVPDDSAPLRNPLVAAS